MYPSKSAALGKRKRNRDRKRTAYAEGVAVFLLERFYQSLSDLCATGSRKYDIMCTVKTDANAGVGKERWMR